MRTGPFQELSPTEHQIAAAYLRIAHIYRQGRLHRLALDYYTLVVARFPSVPAVSRRARLCAARCLAALGDRGRARRYLRSLIRDPATEPGLACNAALRLLRLGLEHGNGRAARHVIEVRLASRIGPRRLRRFMRVVAVLEKVGTRTPATRRRAESA